MHVINFPNIQIRVGDLRPGLYMHNGHSQVDDRQFMIVHRNVCEMGPPKTLAPDPYGKCI